ncbi:MAG: hypothetical protein CFH36_00662 [Alphaproteobacteria bacterium MarineAlpha9_Bin6]|nr:MAG: hypothetical protein CFH36_00662 [Alphaproteobacteria bacterium MarineAlpha9_Bin6]
MLLLTFAKIFEIGNRRSLTAMGPRESKSIFAVALSWFFI